MVRLILASASPRRKQLLEQAGVVPDIIEAANIDETPLKRELPLLYAKRVARQKGLKIADNYPDDIVIAADTVVCCGRVILPKAADSEQVKWCLRKLSGRRHMVITALCVGLRGHYVKRVQTTRVSFKRLCDDEIENYAVLGEGVGKAGGYAIQGYAECFVKAINGSYSNIVGLPLYDVKNILKGMGYGT